MNRPWLWLGMLCIHAVSAAAGVAQMSSAPPRARITHFRLEPERATFGEPFLVRIDLRVPPAHRVYLTPELATTEVFEAAGAGSWLLERAPGDSVDISATFPVVGYEPGRFDLPSLELWLRPDPALHPDGELSAAVQPVEPQMALLDTEKQMLQLGTAEVVAYPPLNEEDAELVPRPAADVVGGSWSLWSLLAGGVMAVLGIGGIRMAAERGWRAAMGLFLSRVRGQSPRQNALRELERVRALGWHREGRSDDFYASSTDAIRTFAHEIEPTLTTALTSSELVRTLEERWGQEETAALAAVVESAERAKFGSWAPDPEEAERDWTALRDWVRRAPQA